MTWWFRDSGTCSNLSADAARCQYCTLTAVARCGAHRLLETGMQRIVVAAALAVALWAGPGVAQERGLHASLVGSLQFNAAPRSAPLATLRPARQLAQACKDIGDICASDEECCHTYGGMKCRAVCLPTCRPGLKPPFCWD